MAQFATRTELAARLGLTFSQAENDRADILLTKASGLIQNATNQTIELVAADSLTRPSTFDDRVRLPQRPVVSVASVTLDGIALTGTTEWYLDGDELVRSNWSSLAERHFGSAGGGWGGPLRTLVVTYTHGYAVPPALVNAICMEAVVRVWVNPGAVVEEQVGNTRTLFSSRMGATSPGGMLLTDDEKKQLSDLLRRTAGSVQLR